LLKEQKKFSEAEREFEKLIASNPSEPRYYDYLAEFYIDLKDYSKAMGMYNKILEVDPGNPSVNLALYDYYNGQNQSQEAFGYLIKAFQNPDLDVQIKIGITNTFLKRASGQPGSEFLTQGRQLADLLLQFHPTNSKANSLKGDYLMIDNQFKQAVIFYHKSAQADKNDYPVWAQLLFVYNELRQYDSLQNISFKAMELFPNQPSPYFFNGLANTQLRNYKKAAQTFKDGLEFVIDDKKQMLNFYANMGDAYNYDKDFEKSDKAFEDALKIDSDNTYVLNNYAYYLSVRNEKLEKAEKLSKKTNALQPNNRSYMDTYGWILYQQKKYIEAEDWLANAAKLGPKNPTILEHYGDVLFKLLKNEEALVQWKMAQQAGGNSELLLKKIKEKKLND
jgi:tetratricopeptide (TPR) repeat protein